MKNFQFKKAFTLIETIVVIAVIGLTIPAIFAIIFGLVRQQTKIYRLSLVKREGDYALNIIGSLIKNRAITIYSTTPPNNQQCDNVGDIYPPTGTTDKLFFQDQQGEWFEISLLADRIASQSSNLTDDQLTSTTTFVQNFSIACKKTAFYSPAIVSLSFDICYDTGAADPCTSTRPEETATLHYQTKIKLRNF